VNESTRSSTAVTVVLIVLLAMTGAAAIVLLVPVHQLWLGILSATCAVVLLVVADRRLRWRGINEQREADSTTVSSVPRDTENGTNSTGSPETTR
jgi:heme A synthase